MGSTPVEMVLFDLGGVLIDFGGVAPMKRLANIETDDDLWERWLSCRWVRTFERGQCSADEFALGVVTDWGLPIAPEAFLGQFKGWPGGVLSGADALLGDVQRVMPAGCLSNTNALHWDHNFSRWPILDAFDLRLLSFQLGFVKPDRELFDRVAQLVPAPPENVLFLDDNLINIDGARTAGFNAAHVRGVEESRRALVDAGVL